MGLNVMLIIRFYHFYLSSDVSHLTTIDVLMGPANESVISNGTWWFHLNQNGKNK